MINSNAKKRTVFPWTNLHIKGQGVGAAKFTCKNPVSYQMSLYAEARECFLTKALLGF
jgi:hypothetical protein